MSACLLCKQAVVSNLTLPDIFGFKQLVPDKLCNRCRQKFQLTEEFDNRCPNCGRVGQQQLCVDCRRWQQLYEKLLPHESLFLYNEGMEEWFSQYKFLGDYRLCDTFIKELVNYFEKWQDWLLVPMPLSKARLQQRGFNQVEEFLRSAGKEFLPILVKKTETSPQSSKNQQERLQTPQPFQLAQRDLRFLQGKKILLVDDVYTTGRTLYHARDCFKNVKALEIRSFSLAR